MGELVLYHIAPSRSSIVHWMLEEIGRPFRLELLSLERGDQRSPGYLAVNPMGKVPALRHGDVVVTEAAAICCYLADAFPEAGLAPALADPLRGPYLKWLFFGPSCLEPALAEKMFDRGGLPRSSTGWGDLGTVLDVIEAGLSPGPYLLGDRFTTADVIIGSGLRWGAMVGTIPHRPSFEAFTARLEERPALRRATEKDAELSASPPR